MTPDDTQRLKNLVIGMKQSAEHLADIHRQLTQTLTVAAALLHRIDALLNGEKAA